MEESNPPPRPWWLRRRATIVVLVGFVVAGAGLAWVTLAGGGADSPPVKLLELRPVRMPAAVVAGGTWLPDDAPVIGVSAGGRYRAYAISAFLAIDRHVANDMLNGVPVTVAYCDLTDCVRVYTDPDGHRPLDVAVGGWAEQTSGQDGGMLVRVGSELYYHHTGQPVDGWAEFPYAEAAFERSTWGEWRRAHPKTDVVAGPRPARPARQPKARSES